MCYKTNMHLQAPSPGLWGHDRCTTRASAALRAAWPAPMGPPPACKCSGCSSGMAMLPDDTLPAR